MNIAVFCSGNGSNFQAIVEAVKSGTIDAKVALMVTDNAAAFALSRAESEGIKSVVIDRKNFAEREDFESKIVEKLNREKIDLICLAGFMRIVGLVLLSAYHHKILNIHPALLPSFKGAHAIGDALAAKAKVTGVTVHFVDKEVDHGPIILQETVQIAEDDTEDSLTQRIHKIEHTLYPKAIKLFVEGKLKVEGNKVKIA